MCSSLRAVQEVIEVELELEKLGISVFMKTKYYTDQVFMDSGAWFF